MTPAETLWLAKCEADVHAAMAAKECATRRRQLEQAQQRQEKAARVQRFFADAWRDAQPSQEVPHD